MFDTQTSQSLQRTRGRAHVGVQAKGGRTVLRDLHQSGSAKAFLPNVHDPVPEVVFLNTAGGLTGGDHLIFQIDVAPNAQLVATTQTAERAYASPGGVARLDVQITVGQGASLDWLPQETILFDGAALARQTRVDLADDARFLFVETIVLGRAAMGETVDTLQFTDHRQITRAGRSEMIEPLRITTDTLTDRQNPATLAGHRAFTTIALLAPDAADHLPKVRAALPADIPAAASAWDGKCVIRMMASDAFPLRQATALVLNTLRTAPLPRVWQL
ncbi:urease accessory protein UreD [Pseudaestuariivita rosea]|uniref:urease accessory protein UreD n=1 Tax=Pseudaestuariivita rosea TaxID=2763263 RepID=UPI001ABA4BF6|nr:urease accessory protein UreD [Pseudaestuariivita rosea]